MNITLSADKDLIDKSRKYAKTHNTTLNNLVREYLQKICGEKNSVANAEEFSKLAKTMGGQSETGYKFDRESLYNRNV